MAGWYGTARFRRPGPRLRPSRQRRAYWNSPDCAPLIRALHKGSAGCGRGVRHCSTLLVERFYHYLVLLSYGRDWSAPLGYSHQSHNYRRAGLTGKRRGGLAPIASAPCGLDQLPGMAECCTPGQPGPVMKPIGHREQHRTV